ncbi:MAG: hypothetical protein NUW21_03255 [Elusimicrobia bacterium]|nr:hypothetical protein [Elusimicrobiota bacterium]
MKSNAGLWIDHREAVIVVLRGSGEEIRRIPSAAARQHAAEMPPDDLRQKEFTEHLTRYYDEVIAHLRDVGSILIFGPGEAKGELKKRFETHKSEDRPITVETTDNMTAPQIAARVREHFEPAARRAA